MNSFEAIRRLATTLGVSCPESSDNVFDASFINSLNRAAKRQVKHCVNEVESINKKLVWVSICDEQPDPVQGSKILGLGGGYDSEPAYAFECEYDDGVWTNIGGEEMTHWMPLTKAPE